MVLKLNRGHDFHSNKYRADMISIVINTNGQNSIKNVCGVLCTLSDDALPLYQVL